MPDNSFPEGSNEFAPTGEVKPETIGRYRLLGELGRGGCGVVYRALDPSIGRMVAIKTILAKEESSAGQESRARFRREARSAGSLSHPNIVTVHDFSDSGDPMFIAMEFVDGPTLAQSMSKGPLPLDFVLGVLRSAADALDYAHARHIVHRDIKPGNFLIEASGRLKITDFGIAKMLDSDEGLTSTGMLVGTAQYMSPEQISEGQVTGQSDQFSLAVIAYEMLTGVKPFQGNSWASVIHAIVMAEPGDVTQYRGNFSDAVNRVLRKALAKDPKARYHTCSEFVSELEASLGAISIQQTAILTGLAVRALSTPAEPTREQAVKPPVDAEVPPAPEAPLRAAADKKSVLKPILVGTAAGVVLAAGLWLGLRPKKAKPEAISPGAPAVSEPAPPSVSQLRKADQPPSPAAKPAKPPEEKTARVEKAVAEPAAPPLLVPAPQAKAENPPPVVLVPTKPVEQPAPVQRETPPPPPVAAPSKAEQDQAAQAAEERNRRLAAEEQAKRLAEQQQASRLAEEQARNSRAADSSAISRALAQYKSAYERKDVGALQSIWPSIPKVVLEGTRDSFRQASEVRMELHPVGDPVISGNSATVICNRTVHQTIMKRPFEASGRVRIALIRNAAGWTIQSVESVTP